MEPECVWCFNRHHRQTDVLKDRVQRDLTSLILFQVAVTCSFFHIIVSFPFYEEDFRSDPGKFEGLIKKTRSWVEGEQCARYKEFNDSRTRRSPFTTLSQFGASYEQSRTISTAAHVGENITSVYGRRIMSRSVLDEIKKLCPTPEQIPSCFPLSKYRVPDGTCNNPSKPSWGKAFTPLKRYLRAVYNDDIAQPRLSVVGGHLPHAREVSSNIFSDENIEVAGYTSLIMHFGQFLDHDIGHTPTEVGRCGCKNSKICFPIKILDSDPFFETPCFPFHRSLPVLGEDCQPNPRQQLNQVTSFIDGSAIYGPSFDVQDSLRDKAQGMGLLLMLKDEKKPSSLPHLPKDVQMSDCISIRSAHHCGRSGDKRTAEQPGLTALHTLFHRFHNNVALELFQLNPHWNDDDRYFQEARRITVAVFQHIIYNEYLPLLLGPRVLETFELRVNQKGFFYGYDYGLHPGIANVVSTSAFRMGHSQVSGEILRVNEKFKSVFNPLPLTEAFFNGSLIFDDSNGGVDSLVFGMLVQRLLKVDGNVDRTLTHHLFNLPPGSPSLDLVAFNIQRGRDHGLPSYTDWRRFCGSEIKSFNALKADVDQRVINRLRQVYKDVRDIDVFVGSLLERPLADALVGPVNTCLLARQFRDLKLGDRFWYENGGFPSSFTKDQLEMIRSMTMSRVICDTLQTVRSIQPYAFREADRHITKGDTKSFSSYSKLHKFPNMKRKLPGFANVRVSCQDGESIPHLDLSAWKD